MRNPLRKHVEEMKALGEQLIPYTFPQASLETEKDIKVLKQREFVLDGYDVVVCYSKADYGENFLETLQIQAEHYPFLPFNVVCRIGVEFLGDDCLSLIEVVKTGRKLYCWTLQIDKADGTCIIPDEEAAVPCSYQGLDFSSVNPDSVNFY
tara:strand:+ start:316 stop:768 length:453 start_codon:yes stop_codon:yes gene_type:complete